MGREAARGDLEATGDLPVERESHRVGAVLARARRRRDAVGHLGLHHDHESLHRGSLGEHAHDHGSRDLVGQVGDEQARRGVDADVRERGAHVVLADAQGVPHHEGETTRAAGAGVGEHVLKLAVRLDGAHGGSAGEKSDGEGADARPHLEYHVIPADLREVEDVRDDAVVDEEVLAEAVLRGEPEAVEDLAGLVRIGKPGRGHAPYFLG